MCVETQTRYICCCETSEIAPCSLSKASKRESFCDLADTTLELAEDNESLCLDCHTWVRGIGGEEVLDGLYQDFHKLLSKRKDHSYASKLDPESRETTRFWKKFCKALIRLEEEEDFSNRMRGIIQGGTLVVDELALMLRKMNLAALAASKLPRVRDEGSK